jgi:hypothetical protein
VLFAAAARDGKYSQQAGAMAVVFVSVSLSSPSVLGVVCPPMECSESTPNTEAPSAARACFNQDGLAALEAVSGSIFLDDSCHGAVAGFMARAGEDASNLVPMVRRAASPEH